MTTHDTRGNIVSVRYRSLRYAHIVHPTLTPLSDPSILLRMVCGRSATLKLAEVITTNTHGGTSYTCQSTGCPCPVTAVAWGSSISDRL